MARKRRIFFGGLQPLIKREEGRKKKEDRREKKEDGRGKKEDGRRKKEDGRRKKEDGRRNNIFLSSLFYLLSSFFPRLPRQFIILFLLSSIFYLLSSFFLLSGSPLIVNAQPPTVNSQPSTVNTQIEKGVQLYKQGEFPDALKVWEEAAKLAKSTGDNQGLMRALIYQSQALRDLGRYGRAKEKLVGVKEILEKQPTAAGWLSLGDTLLLVGDVKEAEEALNNSLKIALKQNSLQDIAAVYLSLGNLRKWQLSQLPPDTTEETINQRQKLQKEALEFYREAAKIANSPTTQIRSSVNELRLLLETEQLEDAKKLAAEIKADIDKLPRTRASTDARINLAESQMKLAEKDPEICRKNALSCPYNDAAKLLARAIADAKSLGDGRAESYALGNLGAVYERTGQIAEAERLTRKALFIAQANNATDIAYRWQWQLGRLIAAKETPDTQEAIAAYQQAIQNLQSIRRDLVATNRDVQFSFRETVEPVYRQLVNLLTSKDATPENLKQALGVIESLQVAELDNFFREACLVGREVQIDQIDTQAAVIYPIILSNPDRLEVIVSLPRQTGKQTSKEPELERYTTSLPKTEIASLLDKLRQDVSPYERDARGVAILPRDPNGNPTARGLLKDAQTVYDWLIRPVEAKLAARNVKTLVFVLDGPLLNLPMAVLHDGKQYLVEKYAIALAPGLQLVDPQRLVRGEITAFLGGLSEKNEKFPQFEPLLNVPQELADIQSVIPNSKELLNEQFKEAEVQKEINAADFRVVHLATHGQFSSDPAQTFILTQDDIINVNELKELLQKRELNAPSAIELLVLSACQTAKGDPRAALGLAGVALRAGARSTLATLWSVNDPATATLMAEFYRELSKNTNITKAEALQTAQLKLLQKAEYKHPYYWAPFVLVGNWL